MSMFLSDLRALLLLTFIKLIRFYQRYISLLGMPSCRFHPTCSNYLIEALGKHGIFYGSLKGFLRLIRCNPLIAGGYDPVGD